MSYPPAGGYGYPSGGAGYPSQQPPYGNNQPPYSSQGPSLGFDGLSQPQNTQQAAPYPSSGGGAPYPGHSPYPAQPPYGSSHGQPPYSQQTPYPGSQPQQPPYGQQPPHGQQPPYGQQPPHGQQPPYGQQPSYGQQPPHGQSSPYPSSHSYPSNQSTHPQQNYAGGMQPNSGVIPHGGSIYQKPQAPQRPTPPASKTSTASSSNIPQEPPCQGTVRDYPNFDPQKDAEALRKAMKGFGTDEKAITQIVGTRSNAQRQRIKLEFATIYGKDLIKELKSEISGNYEKAVIGLFMKPDEYAAYNMSVAMENLGTDEKALIEILCTKSNSEIFSASQAFKTLYKKDLEKTLMSETSGNFKRLLVTLVQGARCEKDPLDYAKAAADAKALYNAGEARWGTDESRFNVVLGSRSFPQIRLTLDEYRKISKRTLEKAIKSEMSGDLKDGMLAIVKCAQNKAAFFAERLHWSMKGLGTDDITLIRIMVSRCERDMVQIKQEFQKMYGKSLASFISDDCSGDYKKLLLQLCG